MKFFNRMPMIPGYERPCGECGKMLGHPGGVNVGKLPPPIYCATDFRASASIIRCREHIPAGDWSTPLSPNG